MRNRLHGKLITIYALHATSHIMDIDQVKDAGKGIGTRN
jgi:hypothetical protein